MKLGESIVGSHAIQASLVGGEMAPALYGRTDIARYQNSLATCRNFVVQPYGGAKNRAGTRYCGMFKDQDVAVRLIGFEYNTAQSYALEFGNEYIRVWSNAARIELGYTPNAYDVATIYPQGFVVEEGGVYYYCLAEVVGVTPGTDPAYWYALEGSIVEVKTPYQSADLALLKYAQSADVMTITHPDYKPMQLRRYDNDDWRLVEYPNVLGPFQEVNTDSSISVYYAYTTGETTITATSAIFTADKVGRLFYFEQKDYGQPWEVNKAVSVGDIRRSDGKYYKAITAGTTGSLRPTQFQDTWNDGGVTWEFLHPGFGVAEITAVAGNALSCTATILSRFPDGGIVTGFGASKTITAIAQTGSNTIRATSAAHGYTIGTTFVGYVSITYTGLFGAIVSFTGTYTCYVVDANTVDINHPWIATATFSTGFVEAPTAAAGSSTSYKWAFGAWGDPAIGGPGYPACVTFHQQRQCFANTYDQPQTIWMSRTGSYYDFGKSSPIQDDDSVNFSLASAKIDPIKSMLPMDRLIMLTAGGEWVLGTSQQEAVTPSNVNFRLQGYRGASDLPPIGIGNMALFLQQKGQIVRDLGYEFASDNYNGSDLTVFANHLVDGHAISEWAYQQVPFTTVWMIREDGVLLGLTYMKEQQVAGWHRHDTDGLFESICAVSEGNEDAVYLSVVRDINGSTVRYMERMNTRTVTDVLDAFFVDSGLSFDGRQVCGTPTVTLWFTSPLIADPIFDLPAGTGDQVRRNFLVGQQAVVTGTAFNDGIRTILSIIGDQLIFEESLGGLPETVAGTMYLDPFTVTLSGGTAWDQTETLTITANSALFAFPATTDVGDQIVFEDADGVIYRITISGTSSTTVATGIPDKTIPAAYRSVARGDWYIARDTFTGLSHLEGETVSILADGNVQVQKVVTSGAIAIDPPAYRVHAGLPIEADLETLDLSIPGIETILPKNKSIPAARIMLNESRSIFAGRTFDDLEEYKTTRDGLTYDQPVNLITDLITIPFDTGWDRSAKICIRQSNPLPITVLAIIPEVTLGGSQ